MAEGRGLDEPGSFAVVKQNDEGIAEVEHRRHVVPVVDGKTEHIAIEVAGCRDVIDEQGDGGDGSGKGDAVSVC